MRHRHLSHQRLTLAALDDLIENGTLADWRPVLARVRHEPEGAVASRVAQLLSAKDYAESGALWRLFLNRARARGLIVRARRPVATNGRRGVPRAQPVTRFS
jgi:hypothetical protein